MRRSIQLVLAAATFAGSAVLLSAQLAIPEIAFESNPDLLKFPDNIHLGEAAGVATNSKGDIFVYTRTGNPTISIGSVRALAHGGSRLFQFDRTGKFVREIGVGVYGFLQAQQLRVDPQDNIWVVDQMSTQVIKFDPNGRVQMVLSRKPEAMTVPAPRLTPLPTNIPTIQPEPPAAPPRAGGPPAGPPGAGVEGESFQRPTDVAWDAQGNIYVADGYGNARIAKYDRNGKWMKNWGSRGAGQGQFN